MNFTIVCIGAFFFGLTNALYAIIYIYISSIVMDRVLLGISNSIFANEPSKTFTFFINTPKLRNYI